MYADTSIRLQAHKGDSANAPENTMAAFRLACDEGYGFIELDPKFTADGVCVATATALRIWNPIGVNTRNALLPSSVVPL